MFSLIKKIVSLAFVLVVVCLVLNLNIGGRPSRDIALEIWRSPGVQKVYTTVYGRVMALIRKDISVEEVFKPEIPAKSSDSLEDSKNKTKVIHLEQLDEKDRKALDEILKKAAK